MFRLDASSEWSGLEARVNIQNSLCWIDDHHKSKIITSANANYAKETETWSGVTLLQYLTFIRLPEKPVSYSDGFCSTSNMDAHSVTLHISYHFSNSTTVSNPFYCIIIYAVGPWLCEISMSITILPPLPLSSPPFLWTFPSLWNITAFLLPTLLLSSVTL